MIKDDLAVDIAQWLLEHFEDPEAEVYIDVAEAIQRALRKLPASDLRIIVSLIAKTRDR